MKTNDLKQLLQSVRNKITAELLSIHKDIKVAFQLSRTFFMNVDTVDKAYGEQGKEELTIIISWSKFYDHLYGNGKMYGETRVIKFEAQDGVWEYYNNPTKVWEQVNECITDIKKEYVTVTTFTNAWDKKAVRDVVMNTVQRELQQHKITSANISMDGSNGECVLVKDKNDNVLFKIDINNPSVVKTLK
jgi:hypothetical protein